MIAPFPAVRAPGKVFLAGEYGVLAGGEALVAAVDRYAVASGRRAGPENPLEEEVVRRVAEALAAPGAGAPGDAGTPGGRGAAAGASGAVALPAGFPELDVSGFLAADGRKLGLGSSAAGAAALTGALLAAAGLDLASAELRDRLFALAFSAHNAAGGGSGADVAAACYGGVVRFAPAALPRVTPAALPPAHFPLILHGGAPLSSRGALAALQERRARVAPLLAEAADLGDALVEALLGAGDLLHAVRAADDVLRRLAAALDLGAGAGTEALHLADGIARRYGGVVKQSGAGAGDLILLFAPEIAPEDRPGLEQSLRDAKLYPLDLHPDRSGVTRAERAVGARTPASGEPS